MSEQSGSRSQSRWFQIFLIGGVVLVWAVVMAKPFLENGLGLGATGPFFDLQGILAANEAAARQMDPYAPNPLDAYDRPFLYSSWWLHPGWGLTRSATTALGVAVVGMTLAAALITWRVRTGREALVAALVLLSPAWLLAVYRTNNDLVIFVLLILTSWALRHAHRGWRMAAAVIAGAMAVLKYYPVAAFIGCLRAPRRREVLMLLIFASAVVVLGWPSLERALDAIARYGFQVTAAIGLQAFGMKVLVASMEPNVAPALAWLIGWVAIFSGYQLAKGTLRAEISREEDDRFLSAALGCAVLLGCWLAGTSFSYKLVFLWPLLPWLLRDAPVRLGRGRASQLLGLVIFGCWAGGLTVALINAFLPGWSRDARMHAINFAHGFTVLTQLACWVIMGACLRLVLDWSRRQLSRLAAVP